MNEIIYNEFRSNIENLDFHDWDNFFISIINEYNKDQTSSYIRDLLLRIMERSSDIGKYLHLIDTLFNEVGLYPYVKNDSKDLKKTIQHSLFKSPTRSNYTFHIKQADIFNKIANGENIILSAPTSFGKSLIIEAIIGSKLYNNIMIIVPSIALMDEMRCKFKDYKDTYKVITQLSQEPSDKNIYIYTQERFLDLKGKIDLDFFIIDEFYKLHPTMSGNLERCSRLNSCLQKLLGITNRFYMCGPNINGIEESIEERLNCKLIELNDYKTVATNFDYKEIKLPGEIELTDKEDEKRRKYQLIKILKEDIGQEQTLIFCKSPMMAQKISLWLTDENINGYENKNIDFIDWLKDNYHNDWVLAKSLEKGIAFHHGKLPRSISSILIDSFNDKSINTLICTSTLIEGVNTNAKNIIIFDTKINNFQIDTFTFNNISGRSGRMLKHFIGNVFVIGSKPNEELPKVDIPIITQSNNVTDSMLLDLPEKNLTLPNINRISKYYQQDVLSLDILKKHHGIEPDILIGFAKNLEQNCSKWHSLMRWDSNKPRSPELHHLCELLFKYFNLKNYNGKCHTPVQLKAKIYSLMNNKSDKELIIKDFLFEFNRKEANKSKAIIKIKEDSKKEGLSKLKIQNKIEARLKRYTPIDINSVILGVLDFKRSLVGFTLPRFISAINDIQQHVFTNYGYKSGDYSSFIHDLEAFFDDPLLVTLEEFGIPTPIGKKLSQNLKKTDSIDSIINELEFNSESNYLHNNMNSFEKTIISRAINRL